MPTIVRLVNGNGLRIDFEGIGATRLKTTDSAGIATSAATYCKTLRRAEEANDMVNLILAGTQEEFEEWKTQHPNLAAVYIDDAKMVLDYEEEDRLVIYGTGAYREDRIAAQSVALCLRLSVCEEGIVNDIAIDPGRLERL